MSSRILACDDSREVLDSTAALLRAAGYDVVTAQSGPDGVCRLAEKPAPDLVLLDLGMPGGGGREVLKNLGPTSPPVIVLTGSDVEGIDMAHVRRVLYKPCPPEQLMAAIAEVLHVAQPEGCA